MGNILKNGMKHRRQGMVNLTMGVAYLLSIISFLLLGTYILSIILPTSTASIVVNDSEASITTESSVTVRAAGYIITAAVVAASVVVAVRLPYILTRGYARMLRKFMKILKIPQTLQQLTLLKLVVFIVPLVGFSIASMVSGPSYVLAALMVANLVCVLLSILLVLIHVYIVKRSKLPLSKVW